ncbi:MAG: insulinase family protein [Sphingopyxis sp.]
MQNGFLPLPYGGLFSEAKDCGSMNDDMKNLIHRSSSRRGNSARQLASLLLGATLLCATFATARNAPRQPPVASSVTPPAAAVDHRAWLYEGSDIPHDAGWQFGTLSNRLRFAVRRNGVPPGQVTIRLRVDAGSLMEQGQEAGWAHLIEHLSFRESRYLASGEARRQWQRLGVSFGSDTNASTGQTSTIYQLDIPAATAESLATSMRYLSGMIRSPVLSDATVNAERPIVVAERRERDGPEFRIAEAGRAHIFAGQLIGQRSTIGTESSLTAANGAGIQAFHQRWYRPERVVIAIAGDMDPAIFEQAIVANFADWRGTGLAPIEPDFGRPDPSQSATRMIVEPSQPMVVQMLTLRPWQRVTDSIAYTQGLMMNSLASQIVNRQLEERARSGGHYLAAQISRDKPDRSADITGLSVVPINNDWEGGLNDARSVIATAMATRPTEAAIAREFAEVETYLTRELANAQNEPGTKQADDLLDAVDIGETVTSPDHALTIWQSLRPLVTPAEMQRRIIALFEGDTHRFLLISPTAVANGEQMLSAAAARPATLLAASDATERQLSFADLPALGRRGTLVSRAPVERFGMERMELSNGVTALVRNIDIEPNKIRVLVRWGGGRRALSPARPNLLWTGAGALIESGVGPFDQSALDRLVNGRQIGMGFDVDDDAFELSAETRPEDFADQMRLLASKLSSPGWQASPVQRIRSGRLSSYDLIRNSPMAVMESELDSLIYSGDRRFAPPTRAEVEALTPQSFRAFWEPLLRQGPIEVQIFGDLSRVDLEGVMLDSFGALAPRRAAAMATGGNDVRIVAVPATPIISRHTGGDSQAALVLAYPTIGGAETVRLSRQLDILAAIFNDRLYDRLRDQGGASYSQAVTSHWSEDFAHGSYLFVGGLVRPQDSHLMASAAREIAAQLVAQPVSNDELQRAIGPATEQVVRASSGNVFWMYQTEGATRDPRRFAALRTYLTDLNSVTAADLQSLARAYLSPERAIPILILPRDAPVPPLGSQASISAVR